MKDDTEPKPQPHPGEDPYLDLGRAIAAACPPGFEMARLEGELEEAAAILSLVCQPQDGPEFRPILELPEQVRIARLLAEIRAAMTEGERPWRKCVVTLRKGGRFAMDVEY